MIKYEYKVLPAPKKAERAKGVKGTEARFAHSLTNLMNDFGRDGWEYVRADALPCETRSGLTGKSTAFQNVLIFRRELDELAENEEIVANEVDDTVIPVFASRAHDNLGAKIPSLGPASSKIHPSEKPLVLKSVRAIDRSNEFAAE